MLNFVLYAARNREFDAETGVDSMTIIRGIQEEVATSFRKPLSCEENAYLAIRRTARRSPGTCTTSVRGMVTPGEETWQRRECLMALIGETSSSKSQIAE